jgi:hypothetical protein
MDKKTKKALDHHHEEMIREENRIFEKRKLILDHIEDIVGKQYRQDVEACLDECESCGEFMLIDKTCIKGSYQEEDWNSFDHIYVDQTTNGGYSGDEYAGHIYIPITKKLYLKSYYSM